MKSTIRKSTVVAFASAAILATQALAQTNIPTDEASYVKGTYNVLAPKVVGTNPATATLQQQVTLSATVQQPTDVSFSSVTKKGVTTQTTKTAFDSYAFGNKEIIALTTNNPTNASLLAINALTNTATAPTLVVARSNSTTPVLPTVFEAQINTSALIVQSTETNGIPTVLKGSGFTDVDVFLLGELFADGVADYTFDELAKATFGTGTNKTTYIYSSYTLKGTFSGVDTDTP